MQHPSVLSALPHELLSDSGVVSLPEARRILSFVHRRGRLPDITPAGIRRTALADVRSRFSLAHLSVAGEQRSALDPFVKYAFAAPDGSVVESVRIPLERSGRYVVCVSSQVGCAFGCAFCGTGRMGLVRDLNAWEIIEQVRLVRDALPADGRIRGVVFQGMGEPLANVDEVVRAVRVLSDSSALAIDARNITVCTCGMVSALPILLGAVPNVRLAISIGSAIRTKRLRLMPVERSQPLREVLDLAAAHAGATRIAPLLAYTLLGGINDGPDDIEAMAGLLARFVERSQVRPRVSLLVYNSIGADDPFVPADPARADAFRHSLGALGIPVVRRYSGGADIAAACGQLGLACAATQQNACSCSSTRSSPSKR